MYTNIPSLLDLLSIPLPSSYSSRSPQNTELSFLWTFFFNYTKSLSLSHKAGITVLILFRINQMRSCLYETLRGGTGYSPGILAGTEPPYRFFSSNRFPKTLNCRVQVSKQFPQPLILQSSTGSYIWALIHDISSLATKESGGFCHPGSPACLRMDN